MGDCISAVYAEGIHCEEEPEPFFLRESRRRLYAAAYKSDKQLATFFGRPPMMASMYSNRELPLDLDDEIACTSDIDALNEALAKLDPEGWDTQGQICSASWIRLRCQNSISKERILEQSLAGKTDGDVLQKIQYAMGESHDWPLLTRMAGRYPPNVNNSGRRFPHTSVTIRMTKISCGQSSTQASIYE